jgi:hypothetical protein
MKGGDEKCFDNQVNVKSGDENASADMLLMRSGDEYFCNQVIQR